MMISASLLLLAALQAANAQAPTGQPVFPRLEAHHHQGDSEKDWECYWFSESPATSDSPVVISAIDRPLTLKDRTNRVSLQNYWLTVNVPDGYELVMRSHDRCGLVRAGEYAACDHYVFKDPVTREEHDYFIYIGNWPH